ncbi:unnamed protein product [Ilex paraguariensis]|uniref:HTH cro/C1-type domain-containing protein n=1 Tax=Ilex paraguariensis TaxID=185542 RepID=A0ABC8QM76_9AQUA
MPAGHPRLLRSSGQRHRHPLIRKPLRRPEQIAHGIKNGVVGLIAIEMLHHLNGIAQVHRRVVQQSHQFPVFRLQRLRLVGLHVVDAQQIAAHAIDSRDVVASVQVQHIQRGAHVQDGVYGEVFEFGLLRELRNERALSQEALAAEAGLARNYISQLELGSKCPSLRSVFKLCKVLGVAPGDVVGEVGRRVERSESGI